MKATVEIFRRNVKYLRKKYGMTQEDLAEYSGVSEQEISKIERGIVCPNITIVQRIASAYDLTASQILDVQLAEGKIDLHTNELYYILCSEVQKLSAKEQQYFLNTIVSYRKLQEQLQEEPSCNKDFLIV